jgi:hypothetical protein
MDVSRNPADSRLLHRFVSPWRKPAGTDGGVEKFVRRDDADGLSPNDQQLAQPRKKQVVLFVNVLMQVGFHRRQRLK